MVSEETVFICREENKNGTNIRKEETVQKEFMIGTGKINILYKQPMEGRANQTEET